MSVQPLSPQYKLIKRLGGGAQGAVFLCEDTRTGKLYARKRVRCESMPELNRSLQEVTSMLKLQRHPYVVSTKNFYITEERPPPSPSSPSTTPHSNSNSNSDSSTNVTQPDAPTQPQQPEQPQAYALHIIYEYCTRASLGDYISRQRRRGHGGQSQGQPIGLRLVFFWLTQLCRALVYIHGMGIIHRDIKPTNIFLTVDSRKKGEEEEEEEEGVGEGEEGEEEGEEEEGEEEEEEGETKNDTAERVSVSVAEIETETETEGEVVTIRLGDFGFSKFLSHGALTTTLLGSRNFLAPELRRGTSYSNKLDIFGLYAVLLDLLLPATEDFSFVWSNVSDRERLLETIRLRYPETPGLIPWITDFIILEPDDRPDASTVLTQLEEVYDSIGLKQEIGMKFDTLIELASDVSPDGDGHLGDGVDGEGRHSTIRMLEGWEGRKMRSRKKRQKMVVVDEDQLEEMLLSKEEELFFLQQDLKALERRIAAYDRSEVEMSSPRKRRRRKKKQSEVPMFGERDITILEECGRIEGRLVDIYFGRVVKTGELVAMKKFRTGNVSTILAKFKEILGWSNDYLDLEHESLERIFGFFKARDGTHYLVCEAFLEGNLSSMLLDKESYISNLQKVQYAVDILSVFQFLKQKKLYHANPNPTTLCLVDGKTRLKVTGTYFVRPFDEDGTPSEFVLVGKVYCTLWELFFGEKCCHRRHPEAMDDLVMLQEYEPTDALGEEYARLLLECREDENTTIQHLLFRFSRLLVIAREVEESFILTCQEYLPYRVTLTILEYLPMTVKEDILDDHLLCSRFFGYFARDRTRRVFLLYRSIRIERHVDQYPRFLFRETSNLELAGWQALSPELIRERLPLLEGLDFIKLTHEHLASLNYDRIKKLNFEVADITNNLVSELGRMPSLQTLTICLPNPFGLDEERDQVGCDIDLVCPELVRMEMFSCTPQTFSFTPAALPRITVLRLHYSNLSDAQVLALVHSPSLRCLYLKYCRLFGVNAFRLFENPRLEVINLYRSHQPYEALANVTFPLTEPCLREVNLFLSNSVPVEFIRKIMLVSSLCELNLCQCHLTDEHIQCMLDQECQWKSPILIDLSKNLSVSRVKLKELCKKWNGFNIKPNFQ